MRQFRLQMQIPKFNHNFRVDYSGNISYPSWWFPQSGPYDEHVVNGRTGFAAPPPSQRCDHYLKEAGSTDCEAIDLSEVVASEVRTQNPPLWKLVGTPAWSCSSKLNRNKGQKSEKVYLKKNKVISWNIDVISNGQTSFCQETALQIQFWLKCIQITKMQKHKVSDFWPHTEQNMSTDLSQLNTVASKRQLAFVYILSVVFFWWW